MCPVGDGVPGSEAVPAAVRRVWGGSPRLLPPHHQQGRALALPRRHRRRRLVPRQTRRLLRELV